jgi:hypothetical protein
VQLAPAEHVDKIIALDVATVLRETGDRNNDALVKNLGIAIFNGWGECTENGADCPE